VENSVSSSDLGWCPFCGGRFKPKTKTKGVYYEGRRLRMHKGEVAQFQETGILKYLEAPRSGPISQDAIDIALLFLGVLVVSLFFLWAITRLGA
jgi:hypothetical protein